MEQPIKDFYSRIIGYVDERPNGDKIVKDYYKRRLGSYHKASNTTRDFYGRIVARGDNIGILFSDQYTKRSEK